MKLYGVLAEFASGDALLAACAEARAQRLGRLEAYAPFALDGLAEAVGGGPGPVAPWTLAGGVAGGAGGWLLQWYAAVRDYPLNIGGRPLDSWPAFIPIMFELTILGAALAAVLAMLWMNGLPRLIHPLFAVPAFDLATRNRFYLCVRAPCDTAHAHAVLTALAPLLICEVPA